MFTSNFPMQEFTVHLIYCYVGLLTQVATNASKFTGCV